MYSFGELKNNVKRLQDLNKSMNIMSKIKWNKGAIDEKQIKSQPIEFYLRIIHYLLTEYSPAFYKLILDIVPNIKTLTDQKFVQSTFNISRKVFNINPKINVEQFLQANKLVEKKLEFIVELCESVYRWQIQTDKRVKKESKSFESREQFQLSPQKKNLSDDEEIQERSINVKPTVFTEEELNPTYLRTNFQPTKLESKRQFAKYQYEEKETVSMAKGRPNVFPKALKNSYAEDGLQEQDAYIPKSTKPKMLVDNQVPHPHSPPHPQDQDNENEVVTRQQFNEVLHMMSTLNTTINNLVSKFNSLQVYVNGEVSKTNARLSLLEQNVKIIKDNI